LCLNAFAFALHPGKASAAPQLLAEPTQLGWRNELYDLAALNSPQLQAVIAFGVNAKDAVKLWPARPSQPPLVEIPHPTSHDEQAMLTAWRQAITNLRQIVTPDPDGTTDGPNYSGSFAESDYAPIPRRDLPFGVPDFLGNDSWARSASPPLRATVNRPSPDDQHTLIWRAPRST
jgi:hypothetical protein